MEYMELYFMTLRFLSCRIFTAKCITEPEIRGSAEPDTAQQCHNNVNNGPSKSGRASDDCRTTRKA